MAANIKLKRSAVQSRVPTTSDLELGELGLNTYDGKVYMKKDDGTAAIVEVGGGGAVSSVNTLTGAVSLGIEDLDDFELNPAATTVVNRWATVTTSSANSAYDQAGEATMYTSDRFFVNNTDSDSSSIVSTRDAAITANGGSKAGITFYLSRDGGSNWVTHTTTLDTTSVATATWFKVVSPSISTTTDEVRITFQDPSSPPTSLADGDILQWVDVDSKFKPAQLPAAVSSIDDLSDVDTSTVAPTDGQALVWDNTASHWEPGTASSSSSIQTATDFELNPAAGFTSYRWATVVNTSSNSSWDNAGEATVYNFGDRCLANNTDSDGGNFLSASNAAITANGGSGTGITFYVSRDGGSNWNTHTANLTADFSSLGSYFISCNPNLDANTNELRISFDDPSSPPTPLADGDILQWVDTDSKFKPAHAVNSVNTLTGAVVLDADDIDDTSTTHKFATAAQLTDIGTAIQPGDLATVATSGDYDDLTNKPASGLVDNSTSATSIGLGTGALADETTGFDNTAVGAGAAGSITAGRGNSAFGENALQNLEGGIFNTIVGHDSGTGLVTGSRNTSLGYFSLKSCVSGAGNVAIGNDALQFATGSANVAIGNQAGDQMTTGSNNTCIGYEAQPSSAAVSNEITLGHTTVTKFRVPGINFTLKDNGGTPTQGQVLTADIIGEGYWADAVGASSLNDLSDAQSNNTFSVALGANAGGSLPNFTAAVGVGALASISTPGGNSALGFSALNSCTTGEANTAIGYRAAKDLTTGDNNIAIGREAMDSCGDNPSDNIAIGRVALQDVTGDSNTCIGALSGTQITTGVNNVCVGTSSGTILTTGDNNVFIGGNAGDSTIGSNNVCIGDNADPINGTVSNSVTLGNSSITALRCAVQTISSLSDGRDKTNVQELPEGLAFIDSLNPVKFQWQTREGIPKDGTYEAGFIAQDLQSAQTASNADYLGLVMDENPERLEVSYGKLVPILVKAIQELKSEVEQLKSNA